MWSMAPADLPALAAYQTKEDTSTYTTNRNSHKGIPSYSRAPSTSASASTSTVLSTTPSTSSISGGSAESYDGVREMLCTQPSWRREQEEVLLQPYNYLASRPGKEIRSQMIDAFNVWLKVPEDKIQVIHKVIGMLHTSSLLVDDVEDNSTLRRGAPVAHAVYGVPQTINTANYIYFIVFAEIFAMNRGQEIAQQKRIEEMIVDEMVNLHRGQGMELYWRDNLICPTESEYIEMVNNKTSGLLRIVIKLMVANSPVVGLLNGDEKKDVLIPLVNLIGLLFQIRDDYMNLQSGDYAENKGYCEDLTEGKFSFPLIHSIRASPNINSPNEETCTTTTNNNLNGYTASITDQHHLLSILQSRPKDAKTKRIVIEYMEYKTRSFEYTRDVMTRLERLVGKEAIAMEQMLGGGQENIRLRKILNALRKGWFQE